MNKNSKIFVTGHNGMTGSAIVRKLKSECYTNILTIDRQELDLTDQHKTEQFFIKNQPEYIINSAAAVAGIMGNLESPAFYIYQNLAIQNNIIDLSHKYRVKKLLFLGSSCIYPKDCAQPIKEEFFLNGPFASEQESYAIAKSAGLIMCKSYRKEFNDDFISVMPTNLYGIKDNFHPTRSHLVPAIMERFQIAKENNDDHAIVFGTGNPRRELMFVDDFAEACIFLLQNYSDEMHINVGTGTDHSIKEIAEIIKDIVEFKGEIKFDSSKPDGVYRKVLDTT